MKAGADLIEFVEPSRVKGVQDIFSRVIHTRSAVQDTARYVFDNQEPHYFVIHYNPVLNHQGEVTQVSIIARDISEQKKADEKLKEERNLLHISNERYRLASIATDDAIWDWDLKTGDRFWGEGFQTLFGYDLTKTKLDITSWREHIHPEDLDRVMKNMDEVINAPAAQKWEDEYRYRQADGSYANVVDRGFIIRDDENRPVRMIGAMQDTSERTATLEKIRKLSLVASKTDNAVIIINEAFEAEWVNESFTRLTGYSPEEVVNKKLDQILQGPETDLYLIDRIRQRLRRGESVSEEILSYGKQGRKFWLRMNITPIFNDEGVIDKYISIQTDITAQKEYERGITAMARELGNLIEYANAPIFGFDKQGYIDEWNNVCFTITGYAKSEVYGKKIINLLIAEEHRNHVLDILKSVLQGESVSNYELPIVTRDQNSVIILLNVTPRWNSQGQIVGALAIGLDVTELTEYRRSLEEKVQERTRELKEAVKKEKELADMKNRFVSIASHEFRTPLSTISFSAGFIRKYKHKISAEEFDKKLAGIDKQVQHMTFLLDDILTLGKSDAGAIQVKSSKLNIRSFLEKTIEEVRNAHQNSHRIDFDFTMPVKAEEIETDEKLLRNVFVNLLSNAIKFSPGKESVSVRGEMEGNNIVLQVKDSGIGIPEEDVRNIFEPFHRGNNAAAIQGTGLGLSIVKKAVDLLKGTIEVASEPGCGTTFTVKIPSENG
jgi:PAS domain S-box-containing protein